jgi:hypothetical protein
VGRERNIKSVKYEEKETICWKLFRLEEWRVEVWSVEIWRVEERRGIGSNSLFEERDC